MDYQLEIKQTVDYPRCRIYREFIRTLMEDRNIRTNGSSYLFYYMALCSYANFRSSYQRLDASPIWSVLENGSAGLQSCPDGSAHGSSTRRCPSSIFFRSRTT
jgi:hypothetical protein